MPRDVGEILGEIIIQGSVMGVVAKCCDHYLDMLRYLDGRLVNELCEFSSKLGSEVNQWMLLCDELEEAVGTQNLEELGRSLAYAMAAVTRFYQMQPSSEGLLKTVLGNAFAASVALRFSTEDSLPEPAVQSAASSSRGA